MIEIDTQFFYAKACHLHDMARRNGMGFHHVHDKSVDRQHQKTSNNKSTYLKGYSRAIQTCDVAECVQLVATL